MWWGICVKDDAASAAHSRAPPYRLSGVPIALRHPGGPVMPGPYQGRMGLDEPTIEHARKSCVCSCLAICYHKQVELFVANAGRGPWGAAMMSFLESGRRRD
jgi:hypothetical protein